MERSEPQTGNIGGLQKAWRNRLEKTTCRKCGMKGNHFTNACNQLTEEERRKIQERENKQRENYNKKKEQRRYERETLGIKRKEYVNVKLPLEELKKLIRDGTLNFPEKTKRKVQISGNYMEKEDQLNITAAKCNGRIEDTELEIVIDTGAGRSFMSSSLQEKLGYSIDQREDTTFRVANGNIAESVGKLFDVEIFLDEEKFKADFYVIKSEKDLIVLGMDWIKKMKGNLDLEDDVLHIKKGHQNIELPLECYMKEENQEYYSSEGEWSDGESDDDN